MGKVYVKMGDKGSLLQLTNQGKVVKGDKIIEVDETPQVRTAVRAGTLLKVDKGDYDSANREAVKARKAVEEGPTKEEEAKKKAAATKSQADEVETKKAAEEEAKKAKEHSDAEAKRQAEAAKTNRGQ